MDGRTNVPFYFSFIPLLEELTDSQRGRLLLDILEYAQTGEAPQYSDLAMRMAFNGIRPVLDADKDRYEQRVAAGKKSGEARKRTSFERRSNGRSATSTSSSTSKSTSSSTSSRGGGSAPRAADGNIYEDLR